MKGLKRVNDRLSRLYIGVWVFLATAGTAAGREAEASDSFMNWLGDSSRYLLGRLAVSSLDVAGWFMDFFDDDPSTAGREAEAAGGFFGSGALVTLVAVGVAVLLIVVLFGRLIVWLLIITGLLFLFYVFLSA